MDTYYPIPVEFSADIGNYYGSIQFGFIKEDYFMLLDDYDRQCRIKVSVEFYNIAKELFDGGKK